MTVHQNTIKDHAGQQIRFSEKIEFVSRALKPAQTASLLLCPERSAYEPREWLNGNLDLT